MPTRQQTLRKYAPSLIELVIDRWASLIIRETFFGVHRFDDYQQRLRIAPNILSLRLQRMIDAGILKVTRYSDNPVRYEYHFTGMGRDLYPLIVCIKHWGDKWMNRGHKSEELLQHVECGHAYEPVTVCSECGQKIEYGDVIFDKATRKMAASRLRLIDTRKRRPSKLAGDIADACSSERALNLFGDRWTYLIIRQALLGVKKFDTFLDELDISRTILAARLKLLVGNNIMVRHRYSEHPPRYEYRLTQKGRDFYIIGLAAMSWEARWLADKGLPEVPLRHKQCGSVFQARIVCSHCRQDVTSRNTRSMKPSPVAAT